MVRGIVSTSAAARLAAASRFISDLPPGTLVLVVGASRGAADDFARAVSRPNGASFGVFRFSLIELAARAVALSGTSGHVPATSASAEAIATRAVFDMRQANDLAYFAPVATTPGFPRALAHTLHEVRLAGIDSDRLGRHGAAARDLARLLQRFESQMAEAHTDDRAALLTWAAEAWRGAAPNGEAALPWAGVPVVMLDLPVDSIAEQTFVRAMLERAAGGVATIAHGDERAEAAIRAAGITVEAVEDDAAAQTDLWHLRRFVFTNERLVPRQRAGDVRLCSAPGEGREAVEMARRILDEASSGVRFDEMAVLLRAPQQYVGLIEHACARAGIPVYFDRGTRRPDPAGRAFVALLSCAVEHLSARRFDEYLSLAQVPRIVNDRTDGAAPGRPMVLPDDEVFQLVADDADIVSPEAAVPEAPATDSDEEAIVAGTLRAPWKWEELIVESSVVGGRTREEGRERWRRRLDGLARDYEYRIRELRGEEPESPRLSRYERDLRNLRHLREFALPLIDRLADWPDEATWGEWLDLFSELATVALSRPARVLQALAALRPMAAVGPVSIEETRDVLRERLISLDWNPPARRYGQVFVGTAHQARGRTFRVVFVPGLAERIVPQRPREDPLLLDIHRRSLGASLLLQEERSRAERLLLKIAIGAATHRLYLSYPRMDIAQTRARVPSFYALDIMRAITGRVPDHRTLASEAADEGGASLAWPAPQDPHHAIDDLEHDLAVLRPLLDERDRSAVKGRAHYMLSLNDSLRRSVIARWSRGDRKAWSRSDGIIAVTPAIAPAMAASRLTARPFSLSALQRFAACPYQFFLSAIHRLEPLETPEPLVRMDPLTRGSLFHEVQAEFYREMQAEQRLPLAREDVADSVRRVEGVLARVARRYKDDLVPAIERVWNDEIDDIRRDLGIWVTKAADEEAWVPAYFEFGFGLPLEGRDPRSVPDPVTVASRYRLHGSVDLIERHKSNGTLRVTDHKTGKDRSRQGMVVNGGTVLQPVLYSAAVQEALNRPVVEGRLFYCTTAGGFTPFPIRIDRETTGQGLQVLEIVDRAIEQGFLVAAPDERACNWCDFRPVCGPHERERVKRKPTDRLGDLIALREMR
jgi:RecB family exonuclease